MHPIRREIIFRLITNKGLPFSKLKPEGVEGNLFMYHLKQLVNEDIVQKTKTGTYQLTHSGKAFADTVSMKNLGVRAQPKITSLLVCQNKKGEYLLYKRGREPFHGLVGFPSGKIHLGESVLEASGRELEESTGLTGDLIHRGIIYLLVFESGDLLAHRLCHIFTVSNLQGTLITNAKFGECFWEKIKNPNDKKFMPGFKQIFDLVQKEDPNLFFEELVFDLNSSKLS